jgi:hypothetical protein
MTTVTFSSSGSWTAPPGVISVTVQCWGAGGVGGESHSDTVLQHNYGGGGGGGGGYQSSTVTVVPGTVYPYTIGAGGSGTNTTFSGVTAGAGASGNFASGGAGGTGSPSGAAGISVGHTANYIGGAGGAAGDGGAGGASGNPAGSGSAPGGGGGGGGGTLLVPGGPGAGGRITLTYFSSTANVAGKAALTGTGTLLAGGKNLGPNATEPKINPGYNWLRTFARYRQHIPPPYAPYVAPPPPVVINATAALAGTGTLTALGTGPIPSAVNQWANSYGQGVTFSSVTGALQSCVVPLNTLNTTSPGSGTPTVGNWLFVIASWTQFPAIAEVHIGVSDDIHEWYREYPASNIAGNVRTSVSYCPNIGVYGSGVVPQNIYVAPDGEIAAINVLVVEVSGLGNWDTVSGTNTDYVASGTAVPLALGAPAQASFVIAGVGADNVNNLQPFVPAGWQGLATQSQTNGTNHIADNILVAAFLPSTTSAVSVSGSASPATDLSGFMLSVYVAGNSPVPAGHNPNWPLMIFEAGFGSGYNTPDSEITWTDLSSRLWSWQETTGIQYQLGQLQSSNLTVHLDDVDGYLIPSNTSSPYYPNVVPGTPLRLRAALGTMAGDVIDRWYVIQRNATQWGEEIDEVFRRYCEVSGTDVWAALSVTPPSPYRQEVYESGPYAWWPLDDQPGSSGVLPVTMLNAAIGNTKTLNATLSPVGAAIQPYHDTVGNNATSFTTGTGAQIKYYPGLPPGAAIYQSGTNGGWMFGDPQSSPATLEADTGNPVTSTPGSASWTATGQAGSGGGSGWFLYCNDPNFPSLANGITVEIWFKVPYYGSSNGWLVWDLSEGLQEIVSLNPVTQQPYNSPVTLWEIATASAPVCELQLSGGVEGGTLNLITFNGTAATIHPVFTASDLRDNSWHMATVTLTPTAWQVWLDGGSNADVTGTSATMTSAWSYLILNGDFGVSGGNSPSSLENGGNISLSHVAVYPYALPYYRILDHYWAAVTAFGQLPAPQGVQIGWTNQVEQPTGVALMLQVTQNAFVADGSLGGSSLGSPAIVIGNPNGGYNAQAGIGMTAVVVAVDPVSGVTSGPSAWVSSGSVFYELATATGPVYNLSWPFIQWTGVAPQFYVYTAQSTGSEVQAAVVTGNSESFASGYGSAGAGQGITHLSGGSGSTPPPASTIGDTVGQRIERLMRGGRFTSTNRCIDPAPLLVQAPGVNAGTQAGAAIQAIQQSDSGMLFVDNLNHITYWQRPHLASQYASPVWQIGPTTNSGHIPYYREIRWITDPQRVFDAITVAPISPTGASLPIITPSNSTAVIAAQARFGAQPLTITSWLQDQTQLQPQADWLFSNFGVPQRHAERVRIVASAYPLAWELVLGINIGDIVHLEDWIIGGGGSIYTFRVTEIQRRFTCGFGANPDMTGEVTLICDYEPPSYWGGPVMLGSYMAQYTYAYT